MYIHLLISPSNRSKLTRFKNQIPKYWRKKYPIRLCLQSSVLNVLKPDGNSRDVCDNRQNRIRQMCQTQYVTAKILLQKNKQFLAATKISFTHRNKKRTKIAFRQRFSRI